MGGGGVRPPSGGGTGSTTTPRPQLKAPSKRTMLIAGAALAVIITIGGAFAFLTRTITVDVEGQGAVSEDVLMDLISSGEREMDDAVKAQDANASADSHCFLSKRKKDAEEVQPFLRCGPVLFVDAPDEEARWMTMDFYADTSEGRGPEVTDRAIAKQGGTIVSVHNNDTLERGEYLFRPDGIKPTDEKLEFPDPPAPDPDNPSASDGSAATVPTDFAQVVDGQIGVELEDVNLDIIGLNFSMHIDGYATEKRITNGESVIVAPKGSELLVVHYSWDTTNSNSYDSPDFAVSVDGTNRSVEIPSGSGTLIAAVPQDAEDLGINAAEETLDQTLSLSTGKRSGDTPAIIYRDPASRSVSVNSTIQIPMTDVCLTAGCKPTAGLQTQIVFGRADLVWTQTSSDLVGYSGSDAVPADSESAYLVLEVTKFNIVGPSVPYYVNDPQLGPDMISLTADGKAYTPESGFDLPGYLAFEVPADITEATLTITPGDNVQEVSSPDRVYNYGQAKGEATITFPAG